ncbi:MAG: hypothetical protein OSA84_03480 [Akkermansiaceae bacterium]|nr:hypothetical protein [Akkermansiaceae bacterium]
MNKLLYQRLKNGELAVSRQEKKTLKPPHHLRASVWLVDLWWLCFQEVQAAPRFGAVVVETGVETFEDF